MIYTGIGGNLSKKIRMDKEKYLDRIKYSGSLKPDLDVLKKLQKNHLLHIPFENLDIHNQIPIELHVDRIYEKIVLKNRGGFCYELNGLFYELLRLSGFNAKRISARVYNNDHGYGPEFDHLAIIVKLGGSEYLTDVGFGEFIFEPLELKLGEIQKDERGIYAIDKLENGYFRVNKIDDGESTPEFIFKKTERALSDYKDMCEYHQSDPHSHFMKRKVISLPTENGRITISDNILKIKEGNITTEKELKNDAEFEKELWKKFKISLEKPVAKTLYKK